MAKLNEKKVKWILQEVESGTAVSRVAAIQKVSRQWVYDLLRRHRETGELPVPRRAGRKAASRSASEVSLVLRYRETYGLGACGLELAMARDGVRVPHNRIHGILRDHGLASPDPRKQRRRRYVRYERPHAMDLWHTDWYEHVPGAWWVVFEDDASRLVTGAAVHPVPTTDATIDAFRAATEAW